jgi:hypothetical protein
MEGQVSLQPGGVDDWVDANLNRPLTTADRIWTDRDSRAELSMASAALRMGSETSITLTNLDDNIAQIELDQGTLNLSVRYLDEGEIVEVDTPNFAYTVTRSGEYRFAAASASASARDNHFPTPIPGCQRPMDLTVGARCANVRKFRRRRQAMSPLGR